VNTDASNIMLGGDFNIGFNGWRFYGEALIDDSNGEYFQFKSPSHPDKLAFLVGLEFRGYLLTTYLKLPREAELIVENLYVNFEYGVVSKYTFSRDPNFNYEYVRDEYRQKYDYSNPPAQSEIDRVNRVGNFIGFMYGPNSDCIDCAIGWRSDLFNVKEYNTGNPREGSPTDEYFQSMKKKKYPDRLIKLQLHYRHYRLGDERDVIMPFYWNEHPVYDENHDGVAGTLRRTEFLARVVEVGNFMDLNLYSDIIRIDRFVVGAETKFNFLWKTLNYGLATENTTFNFRWDIGLIISW